mgnify:CR=1 FL=1
MCLGIPGQIVEIIDADIAMAQVDIAGVKRPVNIACIIEADETAADCIDAWVLVHVGFAMSRIDAAEAARTLEMLQQLGELQQEQQLMQDSAK